MRWVFLAALAVAGAGCGRLDQSYQDLIGASHAAPAPVRSADRHELGRAIYNFRCYYCHGYSGDARTLAATFIDPPPRDFSATPPEALPREVLLNAVRDGKPGTAMKGFRGILSEADIETVADFVREEFMVRRAVNTRYHTAANGWPEHERYSVAYPFATGALALDTPWEKLTPSQADGKRLFLATCITCHDRARVDSQGVEWEGRPLSYPRNNYVPGSPAAVDAMTGASPYALHEIPPKIADLSALEREGEGLFQNNCAFCHGADGTGKNWIGSFMEPHPRNLADPAFMANVSRERLHRSIRDGLPDTSMPAWKDVLKPRQIDALIAYIARAFHPVGG